MPLRGKEGRKLRFSDLVRSLSKRKGVRNPKALAGAIENQARKHGGSVSAAVKALKRRKRRK